jgi:hypothetical protein
MRTQSSETIQLRVRAPQLAIMRSEQRFRVLVAGRRFGKTQVALLELIRAVCAKDRIAWYVAPTYKQAKRIAWQRLKNAMRPLGPVRISETELRMEFPWGATAALRGADNYDSLRGEGLDFVVLDEYASMWPEAWTQVLRPMLSDRQGRALFIGTPQGRNHFYELFDAAQSQTDWATFQFTTEQGGNVSATELEAAARVMDERTYRQEFLATFETLGTGRAYYAFEREHNVRPLVFERGQPLFWSLDFNVNPMCAVVGQVIQGEGVHVLDEIVLEDSNTPAACEAFLKRMEPWSREAPQSLWIYGDATGDNRHSSASHTDWQIVKDFLARHAWRFQASHKVPSDNPAVKDRIHCLNALLRNYLGQRRLLIDPSCRELIRDLERVAWKTDPHGNATPELDKSDRRRTHTSDALGYMIAREFPMRDSIGYRGERLL